MRTMLIATDACRASLANGVVAYGRRRPGYIPSLAGKKSRTKISYVQKNESISFNPYLFYRNIVVFTVTTRAFNLT